MRSGLSEWECNLVTLSSHLSCLGGRKTEIWSILYVALEQMG